MNEFTEFWKISVRSVVVLCAEELICNARMHTLMCRQINAYIMLGLDACYIRAQGIGALSGTVSCT